MWWCSLVLASELRLVGFSTTGSLATVAVLEEHRGAWTAEIQTLDVAAGTWNHLPVRGGGPGPDEAIRAALASVKPGYAGGRSSPERLRTWAEGSRAHEHEGEHVLVHHVRLGAEDGRWTLVERPTGRDCGMGVEVEPWLRWAPPGGEEVERLADRVPRRWPGCAVAFDVHAVWQGPRGRVVVAVRVIYVEEGGTRVGWLVASG